MKKLISEDKDQLSDLMDKEELFFDFFKKTDSALSCTFIDEDERFVKTVFNPALDKLFKEIKADTSLFYNKELLKKEFKNYSDFLEKSLKDKRKEKIELRIDQENRKLSLIISASLYKTEKYKILKEEYKKKEERDLVKENRELLRFKEMVDNTEEAVFLLEDEIIIECNPAALKLYGLKKEDIIGKHPVLIAASTKRYTRESIQKARKIVKKALMQEGHCFLWQHEKEDGSLFVAELIISSIRDIKSSDGRIKKRFVMLIRDISKSHKINLELQKSEQRFRQLFELAPVPLCLIDLDGKIAGGNRSLLKVLGYSIQDVSHIEEWWETAYPDPEYRKEAMALWNLGVKNIVEKGQEFKETEIKICCKNREIKSFMVGGAMVGQKLMVSFHDISEQRIAQTELKQLNAKLEDIVAEKTLDLKQAIEDLKLTQEELIRSEKLSSLGALVAGIAHELNTPIGNAVMLGSTIKNLKDEFLKEIDKGLKRSSLNHFIESFEEANHIMERNLKRAAELISSFKQIAIDQSSYQDRKFNLAELLQEIKLTLKQNLKLKNVELTEDIDKDIYMDSYPGPLSQILINIINNAIVHAFEDKRQENIIVVKGRTLLSDKVHIEISDNGRGIETEKLSRIFDPFFTTKMGQGGSGLGLHIAYSLANEILLGSIYVQSERDKGTSFILKLPLKADKSRIDNNIKIRSQA